MKHAEIFYCCDICCVGRSSCVSFTTAGGAFIANQNGVAKAATAANATIEVKTPPGWHHGRKVGWHGGHERPAWQKNRDGRDWPSWARRSVTFETRPQLAAAAWSFYNFSADSVLQFETWPELKPLRNQRLRWSELPWVNESGTT